MVQRRAFDSDPKHLPGFFGRATMLVWMVAVDPDKVTGPDGVRLPHYSYRSTPFQAQNEFVTGEMVTANSMLTAGDEVAGARDCVEDLLMRDACCAVERHQKFHDRIVQLLESN